MHELLTKYGDVFLMWFDTPRTISEEQSEELYQLVKSLQPECLVNSRIGNGKGNYSSLGDNQIPTSVLDKAYESPVTLNDTWGYKHYDHNWKTSEEIIEMLIKLASRNVNFLLNIGPMGDGRLTTETMDILNGIADWTALNGEAIYNTAGNPTRCDFDWGFVTADKNKVYMCFKEDREQTVELNGLLSKVRRVYSLGSKRAVNFYQLMDDQNERFQLKVHIPKTNRYMPVFAVECDETPVFDQSIQQQNDSLVLYPLVSRIFDGKLKEGKSVKIENRYLDYDQFGRIKVDISGILTGWSKHEDYIEWEAKFLVPGNYRVELIRDHTIGNTMDNDQYEVEIALSDGNYIKTGLRQDFMYSDSRTSAHNARIGSVCGNIHISKADVYNIRIRLVEDILEGGNGLPLVAIRFVRHSCT